VLDVAIRRFASDGFRATSLSDIARDAGITPATTYAYFAGKEALFEAAVDADAAALLDEARERMTGATVRERWVPWIANLIGALEDHPLAERVLAGREPEKIGRLLDISSLQDVQGELETDLRAGQESGEIRRDIDAHALAQGIETVVLALLMAYAQAGPRDGSRAAGVFSLLDAALLVPQE
jgi:AcrR family transcriptional regulator